jgi:hypothetical protein
MAQTAVTGFTEPFQDTHPFYRATYFRVVGRTATGSGVGTSSVVHGSAQVRLGQLTDFSFPYRFGGRYYLGVRAVLTVTATASGTGTASSVAQVLRQRQASGSGTGTSTAVRVSVAIRTATGSGVGTMDSTGLHIAPRTATGDGTGSGTAVGEILPVRTATGNGVGSATTISIHVVVRTSTGTGQGTSATSSYVTAIRTSSGSGEGTSTTVGARALFRTGTGAGDGTATADWDKSHIFRVPITEGYPFAVRLSEDAPDRLFAFTPQGVRAKNLYRLTDGSYTTTDPRRPELITRTYLGGHDNFLTDPEITELTAAGYGSSIT